MTDRRSLRPRAALLVAALVLLAAPRFSSSQDLDGFTRILLPLYFSNAVTGEHESRFAGSFQAYASRPTRYFPRYVNDGSGGSDDVIANIWGYSPDPFNLPYEPRTAGGRILFVEDPAAGGFVTNLVLESYGSTPSPYETAVPAVPEASFFETSTAILGLGSRWEGYPEPVPLLRHDLRIYDIDARGDGVVHVQAFYLAYGLYPQEVFNDTYSLTHRDGDDPSYPFYARTRLQQPCGTADPGSLCEGGSWYVVVTSLTPGLRFWPMVSQTDNESQQVQLFWPR